MTVLAAHYFPNQGSHSTMTKMTKVLPEGLTEEEGTLATLDRASEELDPELALGQRRGRRMKVCTKGKTQMTAMRTESAREATEMMPVTVMTMKSRPSKPVNWTTT